MSQKDDLIPYEEAKKAVQDMSRRVALLHISYARTLVDELGEEKGKELIRKAIWKYGSHVGEATRRRVEAMGLSNEPGNFGKGSDLSPIGFDQEKVMVDGEERKRGYDCVLAEVWKEFGEEDLGILYCLVDPAKIEAFAPGWTLVHTKNVLRGDDCCEQAIRPKE